MQVLRFVVENHGSIRDELEVSFVSTAHRDTPDYRIPSSLKEVSHGVLPVLGVFGANASGKSSVLRALWSLHELVTRSFLGFQPTSPIPVSPWFGRQEVPTRYELDFLLDGLRYQYGVAFTAAEIREEWLDVWPKGQPRNLFTREGQEVRFGSSVRGAKQAIVDAMRTNASLLSVAAQFNLEAVLPVFRGMASGLRMVMATHHPGQHFLFRANSALLRDEHRALVNQLLRAADVGVTGMRVVRQPTVTFSFTFGGDGQVTDKGAETRGDERREEDLFALWLTHELEDGEQELMPQHESDGTHALLERLDAVLAVLATGGLLLYDELDTSLHPDLCAQIVGLFTDPRSNPHGAQLLFTTHDRDLLLGLRRDEVLITDKGRDGVTRLHSAADFKDLKKRDNLRRVHAEGRIGGVPVLGDMAAIVEGLSDGEA
ncbi:MAG: ATP-binding protein [Deltaproteobacteria bacterium]|nr:ATP-binding protein [Deltaproteobacteria bacterium]